MSRQSKLYKFLKNNNIRVEAFAHQIGLDTATLYRVMEGRSIRPSTADAIVAASEGHIKLEDLPVKSLHPNKRIKSQRMKELERYVRVNYGSIAKFCKAAEISHQSFYNIINGKNVSLATLVTIQQVTDGMFLVNELIKDQERFN